MTKLATTERSSYLEVIDSPIIAKELLLLTLLGLNGSLAALGSWNTLKETKVSLWRNFSNYKKQSDDTYIGYALETTSDIHNIF